MTGVERRGGWDDWDDVARVKALVRLLRFGVAECLGAGAAIELCVEQKLGPATALCRGGSREAE